MPNREGPAQRIEALPVAERIAAGMNCQAHWYQFLSPLACALGQPRTVLDVGAGDGTGLRFFSEAAAVRGIDPLPLSESVEAAPVSSMPDASFDLVTAIDVIEHVDDDRVFLDELLRISRLGVFISTPNWDRWHCVNPFHLREYTVHELLGSDGLIRSHTEDFIWWVCGDDLRTGPVRRAIWLSAADDPHRAANFGILVRSPHCPHGVWKALRMQALGLQAAPEHMDWETLLFSCRAAASHAEEIAEKLHQVLHWFNRRVRGRNCLDASLIARYAGEQAVSPLTEAVCNYGTGAVHQLCLAFCTLIENALGIEAKCTTLRHSDGANTYTVAEAAGATFDVARGYAYQRPTGAPAIVHALREMPELVAAERDAWHGADGVGMWGFFNHGPMHIVAMLGDACDADCVMCWQATVRNGRCVWRSRWPTLDVEVVNETLRRYSSVSSLELCSFGEPVLHPKFGSIVETAQARHADRYMMLNLITNGARLGPHIPGIVSLPGQLTFSIDAPRAVEYEAIRRGLKFGTVVENLLAAATHPAKHEQRLIGINMTVTEDNLELIPEMLVFAEERHVDYLALLLGAGLEQTEAAGRDLTLEHRKSVSALIEQFRNDHPTAGLRINDYISPASEAAAGTVSGVASDAAPVAPPEADGETSPAPVAAGKYSFCKTPWRGYDIDPAGHAHPCCRSYTTDYGDAATDVWRGPIIRELRRQLLRGELVGKEFPDCARCPYLGTGVRVI